MKSKTASIKPFHLPQLLYVISIDKNNPNGIYSITIET